MTKTTTAKTADVSSTKAEAKNTGVSLAKTEVAEAKTAEPAQPVAPVDPFANLPRVRVEDYEIVDLSGVKTANPRKYNAAQEAAVKMKSQLKPGWKHSAAMLAIGSYQPDNVKPTSVMGQIINYVSAAGRAGVPAYMVVDHLRRNASGNKRSHYCVEGGEAALPPIGWAEDYVNGALSKRYVKVLEGKLAPKLPSELEEAAAEAAKQAQAEQRTGTEG